MANFMDHLTAFFSPHLAINSDGQKVFAKSVFDSGNNGPEISDDIWNEYSDLGTVFWSNVFSNPDYNKITDFSYVDYNLEDVNNLYDALYDSTELQNRNAQSSADRAMEFNSDEAALSREWQALQNRLVRQFNHNEARGSRDWQEIQNQRAMDFSERMSNTSYQRAVEDLKRAGLNPKLAANIGGASSPSGVTSSGATASGVTSSGATASGSAANMQMVNLSPVASVLSTYITGADALDRNQNDFVQNILTTLMKVVAFS